MCIDQCGCNRRWGIRCPVIQETLRGWGAQHNWRVGPDGRTPSIPCEGPGHMDPDSWAGKWLKGAVSLSHTPFLQILAFSMGKYLLHPIVTPTTYQSLNRTGHLRLLCLGILPGNPTSDTKEKAEGRGWMGSPSPSWWAQGPPRTLPLPRSPGNPGIPGSPSFPSSP